MTQRHIELCVTTLSLPMSAAPDRTLRAMACAGGEHQERQPAQLELFYIQTMDPADQLSHDFDPLDATKVHLSSVCGLA